MNTVSAVIITLNEEHNIERCLQSLQHVADEIIVVDSFSTDGTEDICKRYGVRFILQKWQGYGKQKNTGNESASCSYILSVDADEALSDELKNSIIKIKNSTDTCDVYSFNRLTNYCGRKWIRHCGWYPDIKPRLWRKSKAAWNDADIHETLITRPDATTGMLKGDLLHYTYRTISDHMQVTDKYTTLLALKYFEKGKRTNTLKIIVKSIFCFIRDYFFKLGFLDGYYGFVICSATAFAIFLKYVKLKELQKGS